MDRQNKTRCALLDCLRGVTVISMVLYHAAWDLVYLFGMRWDWYFGTGAEIWQKSICCTFILLSGFCAGFGKRTWQRGILVFGLGAGITLVTAVCMPGSLVLFGVLTLLGSSMLLVGLTKRWLEKIPAIFGILGSLALFFVTYSLPSGTLCGTPLPDSLYRNVVTAYFGFPAAGFYSTDYFPLLPWLFLFLCGFYVYQLCGERILRNTWKGIAPLNCVGRHALLIYVLHQPVIYGVLTGLRLLQII